jgi:maltose alpha-D-glucosyltransferase / alpha-amylase
MAKWYKNAIFYSLDVETFLDSNGDGVGDFKGLMSKLDYLAGLGITCLWLLPFFPSPNRDNGYDVKDYYNVDNRLGDLGDFVKFMSMCKELGIKVIIDLVINHTSIEHPWFQMARENVNSPYREFYVWSDKPKKFRVEELMFQGEESTIWTYDKVAGQYYLHRFYKEQPDLNISCPVLRQEILKIVEFWLALGVDGFRVDAAELVIDNYGLKSSGKDRLELFLEELRSFVSSKNPDAILLAETNIKPGKVRTYLKGDKRMHMAFNFYANQHAFHALADGNASILAAGFKQLPVCTDDQQWLNFLRHHDELSLQLLSEKAVKKVFAVFAPDKRSRIYRRGIRRRLAPMVENNLSIIRMLNSLLFSLPGAVLLRYGDEIGMGDNLRLAGRASVRTPMQWSAAVNGGFSTASGTELVHPVVNDAEFGYERINVLSQQRDPDSLLNFIERLITTRKQTPEIGTGKYAFKKIAREILVHSCRTDDVTMAFIHNMSAAVFTIPAVDAIPKGGMVFEIFSDGESTLDEQLIILAPYGFMWVRVE